MSRPQRLLVKSPAVWRIIIAPARIELVEAMRGCAPCSVAELAELLDRPADGLYQHVDRLREVGVIVDAGYRKVGNHLEQVIDLAADDFRIDFDDLSGDEEQAALVDTLSTFARAATRYAKKAAEAGELEPRMERRNLAINYELTWLDDEGVQRLRGLIDEIRQLCDDGRKNRKGRQFVTFNTFVPVVRKRRAKRRRRKPGPLMTTTTADGQPPTQASSTD